MIVHQSDFLSPFRRGESICLMIDIMLITYTLWFIISILKIKPQGA